MHQEISQIEPREIVKGYKARFIHSEKLTLAFWEVEQGALMPQHTHFHEQITQVLEGRFELTVDGLSMVYEPGMVGVIPSHARHGGIALTPCKLLDIFSPVREDYRLEGPG
jgi:quercetin dioxygenase-like cupin family protein